jgi:hypothetical protein
MGKFPELMIMLLGITLFIVIYNYTDNNDKQYKQGQIDAINGNIKVQLIEKENGEKYWAAKNPTYNNKTNNKYYKEGQIDFLNGKIKYHLVEENNGSFKWKLISN